MASVCDGGADTSVESLTVAETVTSLSGASSSLSTPVTVTVPVLEVCPAVIDSTVFVLSSKSPASAGETAAADTVTWTSSPSARSRLAVTVLTPRFSEIESGDSVRVTGGAGSRRR